MSFNAPFACIKSPSEPCLIIKIFDIKISAYIYYSSIVKNNSMNTKLDKILAEISAGELIDKITILEIKKTKITDTDKLKSVEKELSSLNKTLKNNIPDLSKIDKFKDELKNINLKLWDIEIGKRNFEKNNNFGEDFIQLARNVYKFNDERAKIKLSINEILGSNIKEIKSHF